MDKIRKFFTIIITIISVLFLLWLAISWIEVILKNVDGIKIYSWNFFKIFPKLF